MSGFFWGPKTQGHLQGVGHRAWGKNQRRHFEKRWVLRGPMSLLKKKRGPYVWAGSLWYDKKYTVSLRDWFQGAPTPTEYPDLWMF